jgi:hypothetical protein
MKLHVIFRLATSLYRSCFVYVFVLLCLAGFLNSCEREVLKGDEKIVQVEPATWQEQIKYAQNRNRIGTETYNSDRPCLLNYTYKGTIESETERQKLLEELFADTTMVVWYKDFWHFEILSLKEAKEKAKVSGGEPYVLIEEQLRTGICIGMEMVDLKWLYKGKTYHSTAIVSNEHGGFVYEHIGYRVIDAEEGSFQEDDYSEMNSLRTKTSSEGDGSDPNPGGGSDIILRFTKMNSVKNAAGMVVATYNITVRSVFNSAGILIDRNLNATHSAAYGFTCTADVRTVSGTLNSSKYHEFAWGYSYGSGISVSLGWNGSGFTISGGGQGATGIEIHRP